MFRGFLILGIFLGLFCPLCSGAVRLYLKDGSWQIAREYQVLPDRVRYYSTERSEWEEIPRDLVDLQRTETESKEREKAARDEASAMAAEEKAERDVQREIERVPIEPGAYQVDGNKVLAMKVGESKVVDNKRRHVLGKLSPIPVVTDKSTLELETAHSPDVITNDLPEFYIRLSAEERFGIVKMGEHNGHRVVEKITIIPVSKEIVEEPELVPVFRKQAADALYKIWPEKPLEPGEYAVVEYTAGKVNMQVWDFAIAARR